MIQEAFQCIHNIMNQFIKNKYGLDEDVVIVNNIVDQDGTIPEKNQNKIILSLIHIEQEIVKPFYNQNNRVSDDTHVASQTTEQYTLDMLVTPFFNDYNETLKFLNTSMQFFQVYPSLDATVNPNLPTGISKLTIELQTGGDYMQMHNLWTAMGAKYQPSVICKMRLITVASDKIDGFIPEINDITNPATS